ncbi:SDR family NAD(P)-dependent oxidoreductase [Amycolatopsis magusensis]|uniref:SDR family NAD(P)-dependent oxidoreductase n=1 Tax=Amycolatopsis magusensis TaxID=882444 RepID=UPI0037AA8E63
MTGHEFTGRQAVVTGAAGTIGAVLARALAAAGAEVLLVDQDPAVQELAAELGGRAVVGDPRGSGLPAEVLMALDGAPELLVLAEDVHVRSPATELSEAEWQLLCQVNVGALYRMVRAAAPSMARRGSGAVLAISSVTAERVLPGSVPHGATKAAVSQLVRGLAVELGPSGVRVNGLAPGPLADEHARRRVAGRVPLGRLADPEDLVGPALFLLSAAARYVTGQVLVVDGGYALA